MGSTTVSPEQMTNRSYIRWDASGVEVIPPHEAADIQAAADKLNGIQKTFFNKGRHCFGGTHARTQGIVKGKFVVKPNLPAHLRQTELFEKPAEYPAACRYSSEPSDPGIDDRIPQPRGFAIKLFGVQGEMFEDGKDFPTHDIELNSTPALELADASTTKDILGLRLQYGSDPSELERQLEKRDDTELQKARDKVRNTRMESLRMYSQTAYRFGDYVIKYSLVPSTETQRKLYEETVKPEDGEDCLHRFLQDYYSKHEAEYDFQVQLLENLTEQPVEYVGTPWDEEKYPWQSVATLVIPKQDSFDYERKTFWEDHMVMNPWHGLVKLQPLGSSNRLRRGVYPISSALRRKMNGRKAIHISSIDEIPS